MYKNFTKFGVLDVLYKVTFLRQVGPLLHQKNYQIGQRLYNLNLFHLEEHEFNYMKQNKFCCIFICMISCF